MKKKVFMNRKGLYGVYKLFGEFSWFLLFLRLKELGVSSTPTIEIIDSSGLLEK
jgi:hypothetical protein